MPAADQHQLSSRFATPAEDKFADTPTTDGIAGTPLLEGVVARFQCRTVQFVDAGDHAVPVVRSATAQFLPRFEYAYPRPGQTFATR
ncbi:flavin reductase [Embleya sp. MST-111070]